MKRRKYRTDQKVKIQSKADEILKIFSWILLGIVLIAAYQIFMYMDITNTIDNANILLSSIRHGKMLDFYEISVQQAKTNYAANYNFIIYVIFGIWQAPAYLITHIAGVEYLDCVPALLWSKGLIVLFFIATVYWVEQIVKCCTNDRGKALLAVFLYSSSMAVFYPVFVCCQLDVISMSFMLTGVYHYLKGHKKWFWLCFFIAVPCKMFAILLALPLILLKQKNIWKAAVIWGSMMGLLIVEKLMFRNSPVYKYALNAQSRDAIDNLLGSSIWLGRSITIFLVCYVALILYAYLCKEAEYRNVLYIGFALWGSFIAFTGINTYWIFLLAPFSVMCICCNARFLKADILVETIGYFSYFVGIVCTGTYVLRDEKIASCLLLAKWIPDAEYQKYGTLVDFFVEHDWSRYGALFSSVFVASVVALLVLTFPKIQKETREEKLDWEILMLRPILLGVASVLLIYANMAKCNTVMLDTRAQENSLSEIDLVAGDEENIVMQDFVASDTRNLEELTLKFKNTLDGRVNMAMLSVKIVDIENKQCIYQNKIGCNSIINDTDLKVDLKKTKIVSGKQYQIQLTGTRGVTWYMNQAHLYPYFINTVQNGLDVVKVNGANTAQQLYFELR